ncbi:M4 family metallopeptidase [Kitasatospora sp. NPDC089509]|uniref:M4 family metallopeptidase n=1 Tax=Kitasatospora sp. NPDC089509 TaxID=3364079 RepID=UPI00381F8ACB
MIRNSPFGCGVVPPILLEDLARQGDQSAKATLALTATLRTARAARVARSTTEAELAVPHRLTRLVYDAGHTANPDDLPGRLVRNEDSEPIDDQSANRLFDGLGDTLRFYREVYGRNSIDNAYMPLIASVHVETLDPKWLPERNQIIFGDGNGESLKDGTLSLDCIAHELTHGVMQYTARLDYQGQSGALSESVSDVFGSLVKQWKLGQTADQADWLIGDEMVGTALDSIALRSMRAPGTAWTNPTTGLRDPQPANMSGYLQTEDDNGGVHTNSGIPNHAFYLLATRLGGNAWEIAGQIWYDTLTNGLLASNADFGAFASATVTAATRRFQSNRTVADAVVAAWREVGVDPQVSPDENAGLGASGSLDGTDETDSCM